MSNKINFEQKLEKIEFLHFQGSQSGGSNSFEHLNIASWNSTGYRGTV